MPQNTELCLRNAMIIIHITLYCFILVHVSLFFSLIYVSENVANRKTRRNTNMSGDFFNSCIAFYLPSNDAKICNV
jgi:hypothetical protein